MLSAKTICTHPGCRALVDGGRCDAHKKQQRATEKDRRTPAERGYTPRWRRTSEQYRRENPLCVECLASGHVKPSECVDHIIPHKGDSTLMWDESNWQALCWSCHSRKTRREMMGGG